MSASAVRYEGWACGTCGHRFVFRRPSGYDDNLARSAAEQCCFCVDCKQAMTVDDGKADPPGFRRCVSCKDKQAEETLARRRVQFLERKAVPFDKGAFTYNDDKFYQSEDEILDRVVEDLYDDGIESPTKEQVRAALEAWMLVPAVPQRPRSIEIENYLHDEAPEGRDADNHPELIAAADALNEILAKVTSEWSWPSTTERIDLDSIMECGAWTTTKSGGVS